MVSGTAETLHTERLVMPPLTPAIAAGVVDGPRAENWAADFPQDGDMVISRLVVDHPPTSADAANFGHRQLVERATGLVVGTAGFFGPPDEAGAVTLGYGIVPSVRNQGLTTEALRAMLAFAAKDSRVTVVKADTSHENVASLRVMLNAGMHEVSRDDSLVYAEWHPPRT